MNYNNVYQSMFGTPLATLVRGEGCYVWDDKGKKYLDLLAGIAVNALGHGHPAVTRAVAEASSFLHVSNFFTTPAQLNLAEKLVALYRSETGAESKAFLVNSGTEANEAALKAAMLHKPGGTIVALTGGFHGRTLGALSVTHKPAIREPFGQVPNVTFIDPDVSALTGLDDSVAAIILEPIQGEAGVLEISVEFLTAARQRATEIGALLIVDEVQTGMGRTGRWFHHTQHIQADIVTLAKGLGGGIPIGAMLAVGDAAEIFTPGSHGTTFGGNPLSAHVAGVVLENIEPLLKHVIQTGEYLRTRVDAPVRGQGLLCGIQVRDAAQTARELFDLGFITNPVNPTTIRVAPPLTMTTDDLDSFIAVFNKGEYA